MPYYNVEPELMAEYGASPDDPTQFYEPADTAFDAGNCSAVTKVLWDVLVGKGFTAMRCHYDGGYDEGFAYFDHAEANGVAFTAGELGELLADTPVPEAALLVYDDPAYPEDVRQRMREQQAARTPAQRVADALEELAYETASQLLGEGFGTGEYSLRGQYRVELNARRIVDLEGAS